MIKKLIINSLILLWCLSSSNAFANSAQKELTRYQHDLKLKICLWDSHSISIVNMNNRSTQPIMGNWGTQFNFGSCALFPGGRYIAYSVFGYFIKKDTIKIFDTLTGETKDLISFDNISGFAISPNEKQIALVTDTENRKVDIPLLKPPMEGKELSDALHREWFLRSQYQSLYILNLDTKELHRIIENNVSGVQKTAWSPDGKKLIYETGEGEYFIYDFTTKNSRKVLDKSAAAVSWSFDSKRIYYRNGAYSANDRNYYSVNEQGLDKRLFLKNDSLWGSGIPFINDVQEIDSPIYSSPDGKLLLYGRLQGIKGTPLRIYAMDTRTNDTVALGYGMGCGWSFSDALRFTIDDNGNIRERSPQEVAAYRKTLPL